MDINIVFEYTHENEQKLIKIDWKEDKLSVNNIDLDIDMNQNVNNWHEYRTLIDQ